MSGRAQDIRLGGGALQHKRHVCAFLNTHEEEYRVLLFLRELGLRDGPAAPP